MKIYITRINGWSLRDKTHCVQHIISEIAHQLGCREMGIYRYPADGESIESLGSRLDGIIAGINRGDLVICQFPTGNGLRFERELVSRLKAYGGRVAILIHELEALAYEEKKFQFGEIINVYNQAEILIVPSYAMRQSLLENGIRKNMKFVIQEMWDYTVNEPAVNMPIFKKEILFTDTEGFAGMNSWNYSVPLKLYNVSVKQGNIQNLGEREPYQFLCELNKGGFGLVWYRDEYYRHYMEKSNSFSLARFLAAGLPVIVPEGISHQRMIIENHLGLVVSSLEEAVKAIERMTEEGYQEYVKSVEQFSPALRNGYFTKRWMLETMLAFYRRDAGSFLMPQRVYEAEESAFRSVMLNKSYGGRLAFSWDFQGEADGFLIYDTTGKLLENVRDTYQHYIPLKGQEEEKGVIIKAYMETLKGKLILAESEPAYLRELPHGTFSVTMIVPAYNAEKYIARCIDTILAQSQPDIEIIVVNDGSMDYTPGIIDWYAEKYKNVVAIHQENSGASAARNAGIKRARGEYIGFLDADDMIRMNMVERLYQSAQKNDCDIAITSIYTVTDTEYLKCVTYPVKEDEPISVDEFFPIYNRGDWRGLVVWNKLYRSTLVKPRLLPEVPFEDNAWMAYILSYADKICYVNDFLCEWDRRKRGVSLSGLMCSRPAHAVYADIRKAILYFLENGNPGKRAFLKEIALAMASRWEGIYNFPEYGKLRNEIERKY